jgi:large subunit ribosomal protein L10
MNREQKAAVIDEIAADITESHAIFAVDYRGITVAQVSELRGKLRESDATLRVVKNSLTERAADKAGTDLLNGLLSGPTALTFVRGDGALAAKSIADFARTTQLLAFKGGVMDGVALSSAEITSISRLPSRDVLYGQLVGLIASPLSGLVRTLNALIGGLAIQLGGVLEQKQASAPAATAAPTDPAPAADEVPAADTPAASTAGPEGEDEPPNEAPSETTGEEPAATISEEPVETTSEEPVETTSEEPAETIAEEPAQTTDEEPAAQAEAQTTDEQSAPDASGDDEKENQ